MKRFILSFVILIPFLLLYSCKTERQIVYRNCDCNTTNFGLQFQTPYWGWNDWYLYRYDIRPRYYIPPTITPPPSRYDRRRNITPQRNIQPNRDSMYPNRNRVDTNRTPSHRVPMTAPPRYSTPSRTQTNTPQRTIPQRTNPSNQRSVSPSVGNQPTIRRGRGNE